jgi:ankyrin repeat protein
MWAAFRDNVPMLELLIDNGADTSLVDKDGWNALDLAIIRINYKAALFLSKKGMQRREASEYEGKTWRKFDIELMFTSIDAEVEDVPY